MYQPVRELPCKQNAQANEDSGEYAQTPVVGDLTLVAHDQSAPIVEPTMHALDLVALFASAMQFGRTSSLAPFAPLPDALRS